MRPATVLSSALLIAFLTMRGAAQTTTATSGTTTTATSGTTSATIPGSWSGTTPRNISFVPVDTSKAMKPSANIAKAFHAAPTPSGPNLSNFFHKMTFGAWPPTRANVTVLDQKQNVFQPKPVGVNVFDLGKKK